MQHGVIVGRKEGQQIPVEVLTLAAAECPQYVGMCWTQRDEEGRMSVGHVTLDGNVDANVQDLKDTMEGQDNPFWAFFGEGHTNSDDQQPFFLIHDEQGDAIVGIMLEGDFSLAFEVPNSTYSAAYHVCDKYLKPKLMDLFESNEQDMAKVAAAMERTFTQKEILLACCPPTGRCEIRLMFANGNEVILSQGNFNRSFEWGDMSRNLGYGDVPEPAAPSPPPARKGIQMGSKKTQAAPVSPQPAAATSDNKPAVATSVTSVPQVKATVTGDTAIGSALAAAQLNVMILPPRHKIGVKKDLEGWYRHWAGFLPEGWEQGINAWDKAIPVKVKANLLKSDMKEVKDAERKGTVVMYDPAKHPRAWDKPAATGAKSSAPVADAGSPIATVIPAEERQKVVVWKTNIIKSRGDNGKLIVDQAQLNKELAAYAKATEELGLTGIGELETFTPEELTLLFKTAPGAATRLMLQMLMERRIHNIGTQVAAGKAAG